MVKKIYITLSILLFPSIKIFSTDLYSDKADALKQIKSKLELAIIQYENKNFSDIILNMRKTSAGRSITTSYDKDANNEFSEIIAQYPNIFTKDEITKMKKVFILDFKKQLTK